MNGMMKAIENLPYHVAEKLKNEIVELSANRFKELDAKFIKEAKKHGFKPVTIKSSFSSLSEYKKLGFDRVV